MNQGFPLNFQAGNLASQSRRVSVKDGDRQLALHCVHNAIPALLSNEAAQCKTVVRSAWHNGLARVSGAIPAWHNGFGIVRFF